jgi:hypothetical protein
MPGELEINAAILAKAVDHVGFMGQQNGGGIGGALGQGGVEIRLAPEAIINAGQGQLAVANIKGDAFIL